MLAGFADETSGGCMALLWAQSEGGQVRCRVKVQGKGLGAGSSRLLNPAWARGGSHESKHLTDRALAVCAA